jgi:hypothetical protein
MAPPWRRLTVCVRWRIEAALIDRLRITGKILTRVAGRAGAAGDALTDEPRCERQGRCARLPAGHLPLVELTDDF